LTAHPVYSCCFSALDQSKGSVACHKSSLPPAAISMLSLITVRRGVTERERKTMAETITIRPTERIASFPTRTFYSHPNSERLSLLFCSGCQTTVFRPNRRRKLKLSNALRFHVAISRKAYILFRKGLLPHAAK